MGSSRSTFSALPGRSLAPYTPSPNLHYSGYSTSKWHYFTKDDLSLQWPLWGAFDLNKIVHWKAPHKRMEIRFLRANGYSAFYFYAEASKLNYLLHKIKYLINCPRGKSWKYYPKIHKLNRALNPLRTRFTFPLTCSLIRHKGNL